MAATGTDSVTDARRVALVRRRLGARGPSPVWRVRATSGMDEQVRVLVDRRGLTISEVVREAVTAYLRTA